MMVKRKSSDGQKYQYTKDPNALTQFLKTMLYMFIAVRILGFADATIQVNFFMGVLLNNVEAIAIAARQQLVFIQYLIVIILTGIVFLLWIYRTSLNCHGFGTKGMRFSPRWSIGYFFIPILNLFEPYLAMKEIWRVSTDPVEWRQEKGSTLLTWWWVLWLITLLSFLAYLTSFLTPMEASLETMQALSLAAACTSAIDIFSGIAALLLVTAIYRKQEELVKADP